MPGWVRWGMVAFQFDRDPEGIFLCKGVVVVVHPFIRPYSIVKQRSVKFRVVSELQVYTVTLHGYLDKWTKLKFASFTYRVELAFYSFITLFYKPGPLYPAHQISFQRSFLTVIRHEFRNQVGRGGAFFHKSFRPFLSFYF